MRFSLAEHGVPKERWSRVAAICGFVNYAEQMIGGVLTGGATLEQVNQWRVLGFEDATEHADVTEDEMRELAGYGLASFDGRVWRVRPKPAEPS